MNKKGFALLSVLWCVGLLAAVAAVLVRVAHSDGQRARVDVALAQAQALADGGVRLAILQALQAPEDERWTGSARVLGSATVAVQDEAGLVDINLAPPPLLAGLLRRAGADEDTARHLADAIAAARGSAPVMTPFLATVDLARVPGMTRMLRGRLLPMVSVTSRLPGIDPRVAPQAVIDSLPDIDGPGATRLAALRTMATADIQQISGPEGRFLALSRRDSVRISAEATVDGVTATRLADVRLLRQDGMPYKILTWTTERGG
jgi:general secretion pathway protein K